jgi:hypothetical protein
MDTIGFYLRPGYDGKGFEFSYLNSYWLFEKFAWIEAAGYGASPLFFRTTFWRLFLQIS